VEKQGDEWVSEYENWTPKAQEEALAMLRARQEAPKIWYCLVGRSCDGEPHDGAPYPHARGDQWPPEGADWFTWLLMSGRGSGKTRSGAEWLRKISTKVPRIAMIGRRGVDVRATMVEGDSGLISVCERAKIGFEWSPSKKEFTFSNGAKAFGYSGEEPDSLRGPQHGAAWLDEPAHMDFIDAVWDNLLMGLRLDGLPGGSKVLLTSTPLPLQWLKDRIADPKTCLVRVSTYANLKNLDPNFRDNILAKYEGTRMGRQELHGEILEDVEGALWNWELIKAAHFDPQTSIEEFAQTMDRIVVGVDPAGTSAKQSDETGIVVVGKKGRDLFVLADGSGHHTPERWAQRSIDLYEYWDADAIVVERNFGGEMVRSVMRTIDESPRIKEVTSRRGKLIRAEPVYAKYEQGLAHHVPGLTGLESQMAEWVPGEGSSPDRVDALVHAAHDLMGGHKPGGIAGVSSLKPVDGPGVRPYAPATARLTRPTVRSWA
jgi:phage terminase large subunit-like protein